MTIISVVFGIWLSLHHYQAKKRKTASNSEIVLYTSTAILLSIFISLGNFIQNHVTIILESSAGSAYSAIYGNESKFDFSIYEIVLDGIQYGATVSFIVLSFLHRIQNKERFVFWSMILFTATLTVVDAIYIIMGSFDFSYLLSFLPKTVAFNAAGSLILTSVAFTQYFIVPQYFSEDIPAKNRPYLLTFSAFALATAIASIGYVLGLQFLRPNSATITANIELPREINLGYSDKFLSSHSKESIFDPLSGHQLLKDDLSGNSFGVSSVKFRTNHSASGLKSQVYFFSGCFTLSQISDLIHKDSSRAAFISDEFTSMTSDDGMIRYDIDVEGKSAQSMEVRDKGQVRIYWAYPFEGSITYSAFLADSGTVSVRHLAGDLGFTMWFLGLVTDTDDVEKIRRATRTINISSDIDADRIVFIPSKANKRSSEIIFEDSKCVLEVPKIEGRDVIVNARTEYGVGIYVLRRPATPADPMSNELISEAELTMGGGGWLGKSDATGGIERRNDAGAVSTWISSGGISGLFIDGAEHSKHVDDNLIVDGDDLLVVPVDGKSLRIQGTADAIWLNGARVLKTTWESLDSTEKVFWSGIFLATIGYLLLALLRAYRQAANGTWLTWQV